MVGVQEQSLEASHWVATQFAGIDEQQMSEYETSLRNRILNERDIKKFKRSLYQKFRTLRPLGKHPEKAVWTALNSPMFLENPLGMVP